MYYFLGFKLFASEHDNRRKEMKANNTMLLALDGDVDFEPKALALLVDLMKRNPKVGAACGRIHPVGSGESSVYQWVREPVDFCLDRTPPDEPVSLCPFGTNNALTCHRSFCLQATLINCILYTHTHAHPAHTHISVRLPKCKQVSMHCIIIFCCQVPWSGTKSLSMPWVTGCRRPPSTYSAVCCAALAASVSSEAVRWWRKASWTSTRLKLKSRATLSSMTKVRPCSGIS